MRDWGGDSEPLVIKEQGSFAVGGSVIKNSGMTDPLGRTPDGQTLHGDHAYVQYQIPADARSIPLVFLHGTGECWGGNCSHEEKKVSTGSQSHQNMTTWQ